MLVCYVLLQSLKKKKFFLLTFNGCNVASHWFCEPDYYLGVYIYKGGGGGGGQGYSLILQRTNI